MEMKQRLFTVAQGCLNQSEFDALQREVESPLKGMRWVLLLASVVAGGHGLIDKLNGSDLITQGLADLVANWKQERNQPSPANTPKAEQQAAPMAIDGKKRVAKRKGWRDVALSYVVDVLRAGNYTTAKALHAALEKKAGADSPFERGTGDNRDKLVVRELSETVSVKTIQNAWADIKALR